MEIASDSGPGLEVPWREPIPWLENLNKALGTLVEVPADDRRHAHVFAALERNDRPKHCKPEEQDRGQFVGPHERLVKDVSARHSHE